MSLYSRERGYDIFDEEDSDSDTEKSSEDEIDIILHGTLEQKRKLQKKDRQVAQRIANTKKGSKCLARHVPQDGSSSEDEFEREMNAELEQNVKSLEQSRGRSAQLALPQPASTTPGSATENGKGGNFYDQIYFDSDEEDMEDSGMENKHQHAVISNDDLLYDPNMDDEDQKWVDRQRQSHRATTGGQVKGKKGQVKKKKMPNSDALLDCPACMTTLCLDCQRHDSYKHQFRAMFVMNCTVDPAESLQCPEQTQKKKKKKNYAASENVDTTPAGPADLFHPVKCTECRTVVGVVDRDEVYHFFNVLASHT